MKLLSESAECRIFGCDAEFWDLTRSMTRELVPHMSSREAPEGEAITGQEGQEIEGGVWGWSGNGPYLHSLSVATDEGLAVYFDAAGMGPEGV